MSEKIGSLGIELEAKVGDTSKVDAFARSIDKLERLMNALGVAFEFADTALRPFNNAGNSFVKLAPKFEAAAKHYAKAFGKLEGIQRAFSNPTNVGRFEAAARTRVEALKDIGEAARNAASDIKAAKNLTDLPGKVRTSGASSGGRAGPSPGGGVGVGFSPAQLNDDIGRTAGRTLLAASAAATALGVTATAVGTNFQATLQRVASIGGLTADQIAAVEKQARQLGKTTQFTATQAADAFVVLAQAGVGAEDAITSSNSALALAATLNTSLESSISLLVATQRQFNLTSEDSARISDVFNKAAKTSLLDFEKLREGMKFAGPIGAQFGLSLSEVTATLQGLGDLGLTGEQTGTVLRSALAALTRLTGKQQQVLKELGLEYKDINPQANTFVEIVERLAEAGLNASQANALFGTVAAPVGSLVTAEAANPGSLRARRAALDNPFGETEKQFQDVQKTLLFAFQSLRSSVEELLLSLFDSFEEPLRKLAVAFTAVIDAISLEYARVSGSIESDLGSSVDAFTGKLRSNRVVIARTFVEITKTVANLAATLGELSIVFIRLAPFVKAFGAAVATAFVVSRVGAFVTAIGSIAVAFSGASAAAGSFSLALAASTGGISLVVTTIAALAAGLLTLAANYDAATGAAGRLEAAQKKVDAQQDARASETSGRLADAAAVALELTEKRREDALERLRNGDTDIDDTVIEALEAQIARLRGIIADPDLGTLAFGSGNAIFKQVADGREALILLEESLDAARRAFKEERPSFLEFASPLGSSVEGNINALEAVVARERKALDQRKATLEEGRALQKQFENATDALSRTEPNLRLRNLTGGETVEEAFALLNDLPGSIAESEKRLGGLIATLRRFLDLQVRGIIVSTESPANNIGYSRGGANRAEQQAANAQASLDALLAALTALQNQAAQAGQDESVKIIEAARARLEALELVAEKATQAFREAGKLTKEVSAQIAAVTEEGRELTEKIVGQQLDALIAKREEAARKSVDAVKNTLDELTEAGPAGGILRRAAQDTRRLRDGSAAANVAIDERVLAAERKAAYQGDAEALLAVQQEAADERLRIEQTFAQGRLDIAKRTIAQLREVEIREAENTARLKDQFASGAERFLGVGAGAQTRRELERQLAEFGRLEEQIANQVGRERAAIEARSASEIAEIREKLAQETTKAGEEEVRFASVIADIKIDQIERVAAAQLKAQDAILTEGREQRERDAGRVGRRGNRQANRDLREGVADAVSEGFFIGATTFGREGLDRLGREIVGRLGQYFAKALGLLGLSPEDAERFTKGLGKGLGKFVGLYVSIFKAAEAALRKAADYLRQAFDDVFGVDLSVRGQAVAATGAFTDARARGQLSQAEELRFGSRQVGQQVEQARTTADAFPGIVNGVVAGFAAGVPTLINSFISIIPALATGIIGAFEQIILRIVDAAPRIASALAVQIPRLVDAIIPQIPRMVRALVKSVNIILEAVLQALPQVIDGLVKGLVVFIRTGVPMLVETIAENIGPIITALVDAVPELLLAFAESLPKLIPALIKAYVRILFAIVPALIKTAFLLVAKVIPEIIEGVIRGFVQGARVIIEEVVAAVKRLFKILFPDKETRERRKDLRRGEVAEEDLTKEDRQYLRKVKKRRDKFAFLNSGGRFDSLDELVSFVRGNTDSGNYAVGSAGIPYDMSAKVHEGERILTKAQNAIYSAVQRMGGLQGPAMQGAPSAAGMANVNLSLHLDGKLVDDFLVTSDARGRNGRSKAAANRQTGARPGRTKP